MNLYGALLYATTIATLAFSSPVVELRSCEADTLYTRCVQNTFSGIGALRGWQHRSESCNPESITSDAFGPLANAANFSVEIWFSANSTFDVGVELYTPLLDISGPSSSSSSVSLQAVDTQFATTFTRLNLSRLDFGLNALIELPRTDLAGIPTEGGQCERDQYSFFCINGTGTFFSSFASIGTSTSDLVRIVISVRNDKVDYYLNIGSSFDNLETCYDFGGFFTGKALLKRRFPAGSRLKLGCSRVSIADLDEFFTSPQALIFYKAIFFNRTLEAEEVAERWQLA